LSDGIDAARGQQILALPPPFVSPEHATLTGIPIIDERIEDYLG
jgi:hypothetical protein